MEKILVLIFLIFIILIFVFPFLLLFPLPSFSLFPLHLFQLKAEIIPFPPRRFEIEYHVLHIHSQLPQGVLDQIEYAPPPSRCINNSIEGSFNLVLACLGQGMNGFRKINEFRGDLLVRMPLGGFGFFQGGSLEQKDGGAASRYGVGQRWIPRPITRILVP